MDKGGEVVVINAEYYKNKILEMLDNNGFFCEISENNNKKKNQKVKQLLNNRQATTNTTTKEVDFFNRF